MVGGRLVPPRPATAHPGKAAPFGRTGRAKNLRAEGVLAVTWVFLRFPAIIRNALQAKPRMAGVIFFAGQRIMG
jgi:hypothetical protein